MFRMYQLEKVALSEPGAVATGFWPVFKVNLSKGEICGCHSQFGSGQAHYQESCKAYGNRGSASQHGGAAA